MNTLRLVFWAAVAYGLLLVAVRGIFPSESIPAVSLTGIPLIVIAVFIARDLARKSTSPTVSQPISTTKGFQGSPVQFLSGQLKVAAGASNSYFENVVRVRLRELLTTKVALETGLENEAVRRLLSDPMRGPGLLRDEALYRTLFGPIPQGPARMNMIAEAIELIGAWKG